MKYNLSSRCTIVNYQVEWICMKYFQLSFYNAKIFQATLETKT